MSLHKIPLTPLEEAGLRNHRLPIGAPSQLADAFRHGVAWALSVPPALAAAQPPAAMPGWQWVPVEPTEAMGLAYLAAAKLHAADGAEDTMRFSWGGYRAMLAAAPAAQPLPATGAQPEVRMEPTAFSIAKAQIVSRHQLDGSKLWAVVGESGEVLNKHGEWEWEPQPSSRFAEFMARCRFASPLEARDAYMRHLAAATPGAQPKS